jgi:UDP-hydrolysing UDP-N-acetyl-D-glucosamine 2-epimerase
MEKRKVCVILTSRAHYGRSLPTLKELKDHPNIELQIVVGASAVLDKYGNICKELEKEGFNIDRKVTMLLEGQNKISMAKTTGLGLIEFTSVFEDLNPDIVLLRGDRFEVIGPAIAAAYTNRFVAHIEGGDVTGTIDESVRHAITKFAHLHFPTTQKCAERLLKMGERQEMVHLVGSQDIDFLKRSDLSLPLNLFTPEYTGQKGSGPGIDLNNKYLMVLQHPVTSEYGNGLSQIVETLKAIEELNIPTILIWPNVDAGSNEIEKGIRNFIYKKSKLANNDSNVTEEEKSEVPVHFFRHIDAKMFVRLLNHTSCLIGNSSAGIKEGSYLGTPVVNIGTRQNERERASNTIDVDYNSSEIVSAVKKQLVNGRYNQSPIYGDGTAAIRIAETLANCPLEIQKKMTY